MQLHEPRVETAATDYVFHLDDDDAAGIMRRFGNFELFPYHGFALERNIAIFISQRAANQAGMKGNGLVL